MLSALDDSNVPKVRNTALNWGYKSEFDAAFFLKIYICPSFIPRDPDSVYLGG